MIGGMIGGGATGAGTGARIGAGAGALAGAGAWTGAGAATGAGAGIGAGAGRTGTAAFGAGAGTCAGATTFWARLGRELTDGRILNASEITSATTPTTKITITLIAAKNGVRLGRPNAPVPKSGYIPVVKSSSSSTSA
jgi:hypothetical protein